MPKSRAPRPTSKPQPSFVERNAFLLVGAVLICCYVGGLVMGWVQIYQRWMVRAAERMMGIEDVPALSADVIVPPVALPASTESLAGVGARTLRALPADSPDRSGDIRIEWQPAPLTKTVTGTVQQTLVSFWAAPTWREKAAYVRDAARVAPMMRDYYENRRRQEPKAGKFQSAAAYVAAPFEILHVVYENPDGDRPLELALVRDADGTYKLDWESYTGSGQLPWEILQKERPTTPVLMRAYAEREEHYEAEFKDAARFVCLKLVSRDFDHVLYAYTERESELAGEIEANAAAGSLQPLAVRIAYPPNAQSGNCVRLEAIVASRWLLLDEGA